MAQSNRIVGDLHVAGNLTADSLAVPNSSVTNEKVAAGAGIDASKLDHQNIVVFAQANTTAAAETRAVYVAHAAGTIEEFEAGSIAACTGNATITVDLKKNGTTVLSAVITLDSGNTAYVVEAGTVSSAAYVAGDVLTVVVAVNAGTGALGTGVFARAMLREAAD
jgi:hypothetical protein